MGTTTPPNPPSGGGSEGGQVPMPSPPVMVPESAARTWFESLVAAGAGFAPEDFQETFRLLHGTRDVRTGAWRVGRSGMVSDPRTILEQRLHDAMGRRLARGSSGPASTGSTMFVLRQRIQGMEEALASHKGNPTGIWPDEVRDAHASDFREKRRELAALKSQLTQSNELTPA